MQNAEDRVEGKTAVVNGKDAREELVQKEGSDGEEPTANEAEDRLSTCRAVINDIRSTLPPPNLSGFRIGKVSFLLRGMF